MTPNERLKAARKKAGYRSASAAAKDMGIAVSTYIAHENGQNPLSLQSATIYSMQFSVSPAWLLTGEGNASTQVEAETAEAMLQRLPGIEDPEAYLQAYRIARDAEYSALSGRGDKEVFAEVVSLIYKMILKGRAE
ncbi:Helix-turn-helix domain protein [Labrenzia sp. THAF191b]|uniref:helix-turn-helix domain-containing protein n=1 Tax=unclassified Labrenzia TaxID=2648686 RepID=UPI0012684644|nr:MULTISPECIES: helix-turn-helix transcriptional regulator [unclassified Labrenzia]QFS98859.1 Helix-turn-helix domain protein [Labrenzia sp. THAF191b]QFT05173.1 Helix-turn-helix domain protein [Labrenzia sp. THAF191a]QFT16717.1 Helix-turn-helix domain protein [Labrenzia sp. THAF187b]